MMKLVEDEPNNLEKWPIDGLWPRAVNQMEYVLRYVMESSDAQLFRMMTARYAIGEVHARATSTQQLLRYTADLVRSA